MKPFLWGTSGGFYRHDVFRWDSSQSTVERVISAWLAQRALHYLRLGFAEYRDKTSLFPRIAVNGARLQFRHDEVVVTQHQQRRPARQLAARWRLTGGFAGT